MTAQELYEFLTELHNRSTACGWEWTPLNKIQVNVRKRDCDIYSAKWIEEDLFDTETNSKLTDIVIIF